MIYAIGDIHGYSQQLDRALGLIEADGGPDAPIVFLGDYTDRGPDSRGVIDRLIAGRDAGRPWRFVMGNHDRMFLRFVTEGREHDGRIKSGLSWMNRRLGGTTTLGSYGLTGEAGSFLMAVNGGRETLSSYDVDGESLSLQELVMRAARAVPETHVQFLSDLDLWIREAGMIFVHAGIRPGIPMEEQQEDDLLWIRDGFLEDTTDHGALVVHGHTAQDYPQHWGNRVNLDGGAGYSRPLVPAVFDEGKVFVLEDRGRVPLRPF